jgi:hypothetical protein
MRLALEAAKAEVTKVRRDRFIVEFSRKADATQSSCETL